MNLLGEILLKRLQKSVERKKRQQPWLSWLHRRRELRRWEFSQLVMWLKKHSVASHKCNIFLVLPRIANLPSIFTFRVLCLKEVYKDYDGQLNDKRQSTRRKTLITGAGKEEDKRSREWRRGCRVKLFSLIGNDMQCEIISFFLGFKSFCHH